MMLNSHSQSSIDALAAVAYIECYLDNADNLPSEIQRYLTQFREIEFQTKEIISKLKVETDAYKASVDVSNRKQILIQIKKFLIREKELGDQKLEILSKIFELIENKSRTMEESMQGLESTHGSSTHTKHEDKNFFSSILPTSTMMTTSSSSTTTTHQKVTAADSSFISNNNNNNAGSNISNNTNSYATTSSTTRSASNNFNNSSNNNNNNSNFKAEEKQDVTKGKRHRQSKRATTVNQDTYASAVKDEERREEEEKTRKKKTRRDKMADKTPCMTAANNSNLIKIIGNIDPNEPVYCLCREVSYGEMIGCDNECCEIEWFHFHCVNLTHKPKGKWFCPSCRGDRQNVLNPDLLEQRKAKKNAVMAIAAAAASNNNNASD